MIVLLSQTKLPDSSNQVSDILGAVHNRIRELASQTNMTREEIAKAVGIGVATVYRVLKQG
nr:helix-turn-helix domain-containing protein [Psychrobacter sp. FME13]